MDELSRLFEFYLANQDELVERYLGRFIVIVDNAVVGDFETQIEAYSFAVANYQAGTFMLQQVLPGTGSYTQTFHSRVSFY
jgi:hypothetical protein